MHPSNQNPERGWARLAALLGLWLLLAFAAPPPAAAQGAEEADAVQLAVPAERASPRATMRTFLRGLIEADRADDPSVRRQLLDSVVQTFDRPPGLTDERTLAVAYTLKADILDRTGIVVYDDIPDHADGPPYIHLRTGAGIVEIARTPAGDWRFTRETMTSVDALARSLAGLQVVEGAVAIEDLRPMSAVLRDMMPEALMGRALILHWYQWIGMAVLAIVALVVGRALTFVALAVMNRRLHRLGVETKEAQRRKLIAPLTYSIAAAIWWTFDGWLDLPVNVAVAAQAAAVVAFGLGMIVFLVRLTDAVCDQMARWASKSSSKYDDLLVPFARKTAKLVIIVVGVMAMLQSLDINPTGPLAALGIGGLAIALAGQETIANLFGSLTVIGDRPFQIGDWIVVDGVEGTVESLGFRSTRIRTFYNSQVVVPNSKLINASVDNYGMREFRRYMTHLSITYNTPPERIEAFCEGLRAIVQESPYTRKDLAHIYFHGYGAHSLDILIYIFFKVPDWGTELRERHRFNMDALRLAKRLGIEYAFPTQTLYLERGQGPAQPDPSPFPQRGEILGQRQSGAATGEQLVRTTLGPKGYKPPPVQSTLCPFDDPSALAGSADG